MFNALTFAFKWGPTALSIFEAGTAVWKKSCRKLDLANERLKVGIVGDPQQIAKIEKEIEAVTKDINKSVSEILDRLFDKIPEHIRITATKEELKVVFGHMNALVVPIVQTIDAAAALTKK